MACCERPHWTLFIEEDPSQGTKTTEDTTATKTTDSADKKRNTIAVSNPTQLQNDLSKAMASSVSLNLVWKSGGFAELSKNAESNQANVTDIKFDLNGAYNWTNQFRNY